RARQLRAVRPPVAAESGGEAEEPAFIPALEEEVDRAQSAGRQHHPARPQRPPPLEELAGGPPRVDEPAADAGLLDARHQRLGTDLRAELLGEPQIVLVQRV